MSAPMGPMSGPLIGSMSGPMSGMGNPMSSSSPMGGPMSGPMGGPVGGSMGGSMGGPMGQMGNPIGGPNPMGQMGNPMGGSGPMSQMGNPMGSSGPMSHSIGGTTRSPMSMTPPNTGVGYSGAGEAGFSGPSASLAGPAANIPVQAPSRTAGGEPQPGKSTGNFLDGLVDVDVSLSLKPKEPSTKDTKNRAGHEAFDLL